jgi:hypothetical protein
VAGAERALELFRRLADDRIDSSHYLASQDMWTVGALLGISPMREMAAAEYNGQLYVMCHRR